MGFCYSIDMKITSAVFIKGVVASSPPLDESIPQYAFIGRSNVGKSSLINTLTNMPNLAKTSSFPGRTQEINVFLINKAHYLLDLPGYGFAKASRDAQLRLRALIDWYLFESGYEPKKIVIIIDGNIGPTANDIEMIAALESCGKNIIVAANKIDKIKKSFAHNHLKKIQETIGVHKLMPCSTETKVGIEALRNEIFK